MLAHSAIANTADIDSQTDIYARFVPFDKLPENSGRISEIIQDDYGYLWFAGNKGLFRYDGSMVYAFRDDGNLYLGFWGGNRLALFKRSENYSTLHLVDEKPIMVAKTLKEFEEMLSPFGFYRLHQSHLIT